MSHKITIRLSAEEFEDLKVKAARAGLSPTAYATRTVMGRRSRESRKLAAVAEIAASARALIDLAGDSAGAAPLRARAIAHARSALAILADEEAAE